MKKVKGNKITMRGIADRQIVGGFMATEAKLAEFADKHNKLVAGHNQLTDNVNALGNALTWCLHKLGHPKFADPKFGAIGVEEGAAGIVLTDAAGLVRP